MDKKKLEQFLLDLVAVMKLTNDGYWEFAIEALALRKTFEELSEGKFAAVFERYRMEMVQTSADARAQSQRSIDEWKRKLSGGSAF